MNYKIKNFGIGTVRRDYQKNDDFLEVDDLLKIQKDEFNKFLTYGIDEVLQEIYPVYSAKDKIIVEFLGKTLDMPKNFNEEIKEAKAKGSNFSALLKAKFRMTNQKEGYVVEEKEAFIAHIPLLTDSGSFIINGSERVIISQIIRSPGIYFEKMKASRAQSTSDSSVFKIATLIPDRGSWIEFDYKDYKLLNLDPSDIKLRIDKSKRIRAVYLLFALGLPGTEISELFSDHPLILESFKKIKKEEVNPSEARKIIFKLVNSDHSTEKDIKGLLYNLFFNKKRYDLSETGRYKINNKLSPMNRLLNKTLADDLRTASGKIIFAKDKLISLKDREVIEKYWKNNDLMFTNLKIDDEILGPENRFTSEEKRNFCQVHKIKVYATEKFDNNLITDREEIHSLIAVPYTTYSHLTVADLIASFGYIVNLEQNMYEYDDIDSLSNRKIKTVYELLKNQFRIGLTKIEKNLKERISAKDTSKVTIKNSTNHKLMESVLKEFFNSSQLSQFMDQVNPLAEISNKRRITSLGPGGLSRDTASLGVRGIHDTHYGRIDPIETPEGPNIGLILNLSIYARVNKYGLLQTPYFTVKNGKINNSEVIYLISDQERDHKIAPASSKIKNQRLEEKNLIARYNGSFVNVGREEITLIDVSTKQIVSIATSHIPFLENDDANRALMGANMQRQAVPMLKSNAPIVGTGAEEITAKFSPTIQKAIDDGVVIEADSTRIVVREKKRKRIYELEKFSRSNQASSINQHPIVNVGDMVKKDQILTDGPAIDNGELAIGQNVLVAFTTWRGYNYEDAIIISERLVKDDVYTSLHIEEHTIEQRATKLGDEKITNDIPNASKSSMRNLDNGGIIVVGSEVKVGDILVGKTTPKGDDDVSPEEKLLDAILGNKARNIKDSSLRVPYGAEGVVQKVEVLSRKSGDKLDDGIEKMVKVYIAQKRKIKEGDKMSGRHGNKGVVSRILPIEDMPYLNDGTPIDIMLNPLGVPSRMNIGQVLEVHLGMAAQMLGIKVSTPIFNGVNSSDLERIIKEAKMDPSGKFALTDGIAGKKFEDKVTVGIMYMLKLSHMVDDKMHARSIGPYSLITQQPLRGKSQNGGQRFGEMEAWALEAYGAANLLQEMVTLKSDDIKGRNELYNAIAKGKKIPKPNIPEGFWVLYYELRGLGLSLDFYDEKATEIVINNTI